ncbi:MAG: hypothetical protein ABI828_04020, partial [Actinomycetota bacterium]
MPSSVTTVMATCALASASGMWNKLRPLGVICTLTWYRPSGPLNEGGLANTLTAQPFSMPQTIPLVNGFAPQNCGYRDVGTLFGSTRCTSHPLGQNDWKRSKTSLPPASVTRTRMKC